MKRILWAFLAALLAVGMAAGCASLDEKQREWIFQPSDRSWSGGTQAAQGMEDVWIEYQAKVEPPPGGTVKLHALLAASDADLRNPNAPVILYLHGARFNVMGSGTRIRRMQEIGAVVLAVDYRGFGKSTAQLPSEASSVEDALAAWAHLGQLFPGRKRIVFGHSLGGAVAIQMAAQAEGVAAVWVEGTFSSIADVVAVSKYGWVPVGGLITQKFDSTKHVRRLKTPFLVVHGSQDAVIAVELGEKLAQAAKTAGVPTQFERIEGGSHHGTNGMASNVYRSALQQVRDAKN